MFGARCSSIEGSSQDVSKWFCAAYIEPAVMVSQTHAVRYRISRKSCQRCKTHLASTEIVAESSDSYIIKQEPCSYFPVAPQLLEYEKGRISHEKSRVLA